MATPVDSRKGSNVTNATKCVTVRCPAINDWASDGVGYCRMPITVFVEGEPGDGGKVVGVSVCKDGHFAADCPTPWNKAAFAYEDIQNMVDEGEFREGA